MLPAGTRPIPDPTGDICGRPNTVSELPSLDRASRHRVTRPHDQGSPEQWHGPSSPLGRYQPGRSLAFRPPAADRGDCGRVTPWRTQTSSSSGPGLPDWSRRPKPPTPGAASSCWTRRAPASLGGQAWWSLGGLFLVNSPEQRHLGVKDSADLALADWMGSAGLRPARGPLAAAMGEGVRRIRGRREARLAQAAGHRALPGPRLGRARRLPGRRARQLGAPVPPGLGFRAGGADAVRPAGHRARPHRPDSDCCTGTGSPSSSATATTSPG